MWKWKILPHVGWISVRGLERAFSIFTESTKTSHSLIRYGWSMQNNRNWSAVYFWSSSRTDIVFLKDFDIFTSSRKCKWPWKNAKKSWMVNELLLLLGYPCAASSWTTVSSKSELLTERFRFHGEETWDLRRPNAGRVHVRTLHCNHPTSTWRLSSHKKRVKSYLAIAEHSMCQPGLPRPHGDSQNGSFFFEAFHRTKSRWCFLCGFSARERLTWQIAHPWQIETFGVHCSNTIQD